MKLISCGFYSRLLFLIGTLLVAVGCVAEGAPTSDPYQLVEKTTDQVLTVVKSAKGQYQKDPKGYNQQVLSILDTVIDFDQFARTVMGPYASEQRLKGLPTEAEKTAFRERITRFSNTFKQGVVDTYANSLMEFNGEKITTLPPRKGDNLASGSVDVLQQLVTAANKTYVIQYSMRRNASGEWKLRNLIIDGINLGLIYRNQFAASAEINKGDIDKVIASWKLDPTVTNNKTPSAKEMVK